VPLIERLGRITALIDVEPEAAVLAQLRGAESTGRPLSADACVARLEQMVQRRLRRQTPGRKARAPSDTQDLFGESVGRAGDGSGNQGNM
jgi:hypothetical protein